MKASEVLNRYTNGERDFRNADLRGQSFRGKDLSGADFSGADIRSANFTNAKLIDTNFSGAKAGLQRRWWIGQQLFAFLIAALSSFLAAFSGALIALLLVYSSGTSAAENQAYQLAGVVTLGLTIIIWLAILRQGFTAKATSTIAFAVAVAVVFAVVFAFAVLLLSLYVAWRANKGDEKFAFVRTAGVAFGALGGTSFCGADLTGANFATARLKSANFQSSRQQQTVLAHNCWKDCQKLDRARVGDSLLSNAAVRELLVTRNGYKKSYIDANLRDADLTGVNLNLANLQWADLSGAILQRADLRGANLREVLALGTDFSNAAFTGACIEAWNIDHTTKLDDIDCQYIYLLRDQQERRPSSGDFAPGEFTKLFQEMLTTVDLIFRNGVDWKAFVAAFKQAQVENEGTELSIQSIENKGDGVIVVRVNVPLEADKAKIHGEFNQNYEVALKALEAKYQAELKAKDTEITIYREQSANMWTTINSLASRPINVVTENTLMNNSSDQSQNINVGRDMNLSGSTLNLGEISDSVTNTINQLQSATNPEASQLADLLKQLQAAIEAEPRLSDDDKGMALEQTAKIAEAAQKPSDEATKKPAKLAVGFLKGLVSTLPDTAKLAEACSKLLPLILKLIGL